jgi:hypothetical protein
MSTRTFLSALSIAVVFLAIFFNVRFWNPSAGAQVAQASDLNKPLVAVIVDSKIYVGTKFSLQQYKDDVEKSGFSVRIAQTNEMPNLTKEGVREYLRRLLNQSLVGALLVGDIPEAWYEVGSTRFPTDVYYMDLNGTWVDTNGNGIYDKHNETLTHEIWVGRLKASTVSGDEVFLVNNYFEKNHRYRNRSISIPWWRALLYMDDEAVFQKHDGLTPLRYIATDITAVTDGSTTNATDYKQRLEDDVGYHWLYLMSHGTAVNHTFVVPSKKPFTMFDLDGTVSFTDYREIDPKVFFYHFFVCSAGRYTEQNYLAGSAVLTGNYSLLALASTDNAYTYPFNDFYKALSTGKTIGDAFLDWRKNAVKESLQPEMSELRKVNYDIMLNDAVMIGDPSLWPYFENHEVALTELSVSSKNVSGSERLVVTFTAQNKGDFTESFNVTVFFDFNLMHYTQLTLAPNGNKTVTFSPDDSFRYIWGNFSRHTVDAQASILRGEFKVSNNFCRTYFYGHIVEKSLPQEFPFAFFVAIGLLIFGLGTQKLIRALFMSERPFYRVLKAIARIRAFVNKVIFSHARANQ